MTTTRELREKAVYVWRQNIFGEQGANNDGDFIRAMGGRPGEEWCALYGGYGYRRAAALLGLGPKAPRWCWRDYDRGRLEVGAKALVKSMAASPDGTYIDAPEALLPGDLLAFHRRTGVISWKGHLVPLIAVKVRDLPRGTRALLRTLEGNVGEFPARVKYFEYEVPQDITRPWRKKDVATGRIYTARFAYAAGLR